MRIERRIGVDAAPARVWTVIDDPSTYREFMAGITRWEVEGERKTGVGARYGIRMKVGSAELGGLIEVVEYDEPWGIAWTGITGIDQRGRWRLRRRPGGGTDVTLRLAYHAEGGVLGLVAERVAAPIVGANLARSLEGLKRRVESGERAAQQPTL